MQGEERKMQVILTEAIQYPHTLGSLGIGPYVLLSR